MEQTDLEPRKLFVGGLPRWGVTPERMRSHFARYGHVVDALVMLCPDGMGRGFGFVEFQDEVAALRALDVRERDKHDAFFGRRVSSFFRYPRLKLTATDRGGHVWGEKPHLFWGIYLLFTACA